MGNIDERVCSVFTSRTFSGGIFYGNVTSDYTFPLILLQSSLVLITSRLVYLILKPLKQPKIISDVLGGIILGPSLLGHNAAFREKIFPPRETLVNNIIARIGVIYFIFVAAVKSDKATMVSSLKKAWNLGLSGYVVPFTITLCVSQSLHSYMIPGFSGRPSLFLFTSTFSLSYFAVVAHALNELKLINSDLGQLALSCALTKDLFGWAIMAFSSAILSPSGVTRELIYSKLSVLALIFFSLYVLRPAIRRIIRTTPEGKPVKQIYILGILLGPLVLGILSDFLDKSIVPGTVLMGLIIPAGPPLGSAIVEKSDFLITNILLPYFFIRIGMLTNIYSIKDWKGCGALELTIIASCVGKMLGAFLGLLFFKLGFRDAIILSLMLNIKGTIDFMTALRWVTIKMVDEQFYTVIILSQTILTAIITPLISIFYKPHKPLQAADLNNTRIITLQTTPLDSELRILCCIHFEDSVHSFITLLKATNTNGTGPICAYIVHLVELVGRDLPLLIPYKPHKKRLTSNPTDRIMRAFTKYSKTSSLPVTIQPFSIIARYDTMHQNVCNLAHDRCIPLVVIPIHKIEESRGKSTSLHNFNLNMQANSQCTVGIFLDRGLPHSLNSTHFSYNVAVFFLGGPDDREAMALVIRMSRHPDVSITLFRIFLVEDDHQEENESEKALDDSIVNEFLAMNLDNSSVVCREIVAENNLQFVDEIRSVDNNYDLVIVGKRRGAKSRLEKEMILWVDYEELGVIGDMIASADFCCGMMSVLVIQCFGVVDGNSVRVLSVTDGKSEISSHFSSNYDRDFTPLIHSVDSVESPD